MKNSILPSLTRFSLIALVSERHHKRGEVYISWATSKRSVTSWTNKLLSLTGPSLHARFIIFMICIGNNPLQTWLGIPPAHRTALYAFKYFFSAGIFHESLMKSQSGFLACSIWIGFRLCVSLFFSCDNFLPSEYFLISFTLFLSYGVIFLTLPTKSSKGSIFFRTEEELW